MLDVRVIATKKVLAFLEQHGSIGFQSATKNLPLNVDSGVFELKGQQFSWCRFNHHGAAEIYIEII